MKKHVLITGATGFIGFHLVEAALAEGLSVTAGKRASSSIGHLQGFDVAFTELDFASVYALAENIDAQKYDYIIHAAAVTKAENLESYKLINAAYTRNLGLAVAQATHKIEKFIFISSLAAIGPLNDPGGILQDNSPSNPVTDYGKSKELAEFYLANISGLPLITFRPTAVYGPMERELFKLLKSMSIGFEVCLGSEQQRLSFLYVKDLAEIVVVALKSKLRNKTYNISDGEVYCRDAFGEQARKLLRTRTLRVVVPGNLIRAIAWSLEKGYKLAGRMPTLNIDKVNELLGLNWACDITNLKEELGYRPNYKLGDGLRQTINWYMSNKWL